MEILERFAVVFEKVAEAVPREEMRVAIDYSPHETDEIRRLAEAIEEVNRVNYQVVTTT